MKHRVKHIHFTGIGGVGMCGIAEVLHGLGFTISGSDIADSTITHHLTALGVRVFLGHDANYIHGADVVVTSTAIRTDNPEVVAARAKHIPVVPRALMLAELMRFKQGIAIAGTHGKTTTTSLTASILAAAELDPTFVIGGKLTAAGTNARLGQGDFLVAEADESDASFLHLTPTMAVVTNIDADHMDTYEHSFDKLKQSFIDFLQRLPFYGRAVLCIDDPYICEIRHSITKPVTTYGFDKNADVIASRVRAVGQTMHFDLKIVDEQPVSITLNMPGRHNVLNALAAATIGLECGVTIAAIQKGLSEFAGVGRRFQSYGHLPYAGGGTFTLIDDYGHHPAEIAATLEAVRGAFPRQRLLLVFQPHRYTRTRDLFEDFVKILSNADVLVLSEVYAAGEAAIVAADGRALARAVRVNGRVEPIFVEKITDIPQVVLDLVQDTDIVVTMGAGSIGTIPTKICSAAQAFGSASNAAHCNNKGNHEAIR